MPVLPHTRLMLLAWLLATGSSVFAQADDDGTSAFNSIVLNAPPVPNPPPPSQFGLQLQASAQNVPRLSISQAGSFYGFSIEMSVVNQVVGISPGVLQVPFLNLLSIVADRAGQVNARVGGNTQDTATWVDSLPGGQMILKDKGSATNPTQTPALSFTSDLIYMLANVSSLVNAKWYLGVPMNDTAQPRLQIAEVGEAILGDHLLGFQLGNEPDLYLPHGHRIGTYGPPEYAAEFGAIVDAINNDPKIASRGNLIAPSISGTQVSKGWSNEAVWNTGFIDKYSSALGALAVERYPDNNCANNYQTSGEAKESQAVFPNYLNHTSGVNLVQTYLASTLLAQQKGKPFLMFETNTASCGGFPGVSDSFGAALWALDYGLQMAYGNFSGANLHVGGIDVSYNPFTPPMTNQSTFRQWTVGPVFYSVVAVAEAFGRSGKSQIVDLQANGNNIYTPAYAIYDDGNLAKVALFNYITDPSGASNYTATVSIPGGSIPAQVSVKYLLAPSVAEKFNITWAGQTLGGQYEADGRFQGDESIHTVPCDQGAGTCAIEVPAPGFALVFLKNDALSNSEPQSTVTFATTTVTGKGAHGQPTGIPTLTFSSGPSGSAKPSTAAGNNNADTNGAVTIVPAFGLLLATLLGAIVSMGFF